ncbi:hypothetical protein [Rhizobium sp. LC145]|uniref:hypothetical protein n=1 Tax=Rhizobium sp. LC145 TaxID=1120688 RepID=UPI00062A328F|nr:hypothetical protein [Rhizobium sp. LC145]KKX29340.1 hypothetical protein YH62_16300 [Rhizobium sp. LC145]MDX3927861.1 hypothetical protein [Shinella sp.]TKT68950.1 hypothetical protein FDR95_00830 [Rhizobiaceae bacterium LC148]
MYLEKPIADALDRKKSVLVEIGTTSVGGEGPQMYINFGDHSLLLSHDDAKEFSDAVDRIASYLGYNR